MRRISVTFILTKLRILLHLSNFIAVTILDSVVSTSIILQTLIPYYRGSFIVLNCHRNNDTYVFSGNVYRATRYYLRVDKNVHSSAFKGKIC